MQSVAGQIIALDNITIELMSCSQYCPLCGVLDINLQYIPQLVQLLWNE